MNSTASGTTPYRPTNNLLEALIYPQARMRHGRGGSFPRSVHAVGTSRAMTGREKTLLQPSPYPDSHGNTLGHDDGAGTLRRLLPRYTQGRTVLLWTGHSAVQRDPSGPGPRPFTSHAEASRRTSGNTASTAAATAGTAGR